METLMKVLFIPQRTRIKLVGNLMFNKLTFDDQIFDVVRKVSQNTFRLRKLKLLDFDLNELSVLYESFCLSHFRYCCSVWCGCSKHLLKVRDRTQKRAVKFGIIDNYIPRNSMINSADEKLYREISMGKKKAYSDIIPKRAEYAT